MGDRRIITKIVYDTGEAVEGQENIRLAIKSTSEEAKKQERGTASLEREYRRLVGAVDPAAKAQQQYARAVQVTKDMVERGRITQEQANDTLRKAETHYSAQASKIGQLRGAVQALAGSYAVLQGMRLLEWAIGVSGRYDTLRFQIGAVAQSQEEANEVFAGLQRIDATKIESMAAAYAELANAGLRPSVSEMRSFAQLAAGTGASVETLSGAIVAAAAGSGRGLRQFGIFFKDLGATAQITFRGMTQEVENNAAAIFEAVEHIGRTDFANQLDKKARTAAGALDELKDAGEEAADAFIRGGLGDAIGDLTADLTELASHDEVIDFLSDLAGWLVKAGRFSVGTVSGLRALSGVAGAFSEGGAFGPSAADIVARSNKEIEGRMRLLASEKQLSAERERQAKAVKAAEQAAEDRKRREKEAAAEAKRQAQEVERAWEKAWDEAIAAEVKATEEAKRLAEQRVKDLAEGMAEAHEMAAEHSRQAWANALDAIEAGLEPLRRAIGSLGELNQELDFTRRADAAAALPTARLRAIEVQYLEFMRRIGEGSVEAGEAAFAKLSEIIGVTVDDIRAKLGELTDLDAIAEIRGSSRTPGQIYAEEVAELQRLRIVAVEQARERGEDTLAIERDFHARELQLRREMEEAKIAQIDAHMSAWGTLFDFLGQRLGGVFSDISRAIGTMQQAQGMGSQIGGLFGAAAAGGMAGLVVGFAIAAYEYLEKEAAERRARRYDTAALVGKEPGSDWERYFTAAKGAMRRASAQIQETIDAFAEAIGGVFTAFESLEIRVRKDGKYFRAYVGGILLGAFSDMESAVEAAILEAFKDPDTVLRGVSDLVRQGFNEAIAEGLHNIGLGELQDFLVDLREIAEIRWDDGARQMQAMLRRYDELWDSLLQITEGSAAQAQGAMDLALSELDSWRARIRDFTGEPESRAEMEERMRREGDLLEAQLGMRIADLRLREAELRLERELLMGRAALVRGGSLIDRAEIEGRRGYISARAKLAEVEVDIYAATLAAIDAALEAIALLLVELERLKEEFDPENFKLPRVGGRGARQQARDWLDDNAFRLAAERMGGVERQLAEMNRMYDEQAEGLKAGSEEMRRLNAQRREEAALIRQRGIATAYEGLRGYEGLTPFETERQRAADLKKGFDDLLKSGAIGQERYERAMGRVNATLERHLDLLGQQESATLFGQVAGLLDSAGLGDSAEKAQLIAEQQRANFVLQLAEAQARYAMLVAEGYLIGKNRELVEGTLRRLASLDVSGLFAGGGAASTESALDANARRSQVLADRIDREREEAARRLEEATRLREKYLADVEDDLHARLREIDADFKVIFETLGRGPENLKLFGDAIRSVFDEIGKPVREWLDTMGLSETSSLTGQQQLDLASSRYDELYATIAAGGISAENYQELIRRGDELLGRGAAQFGTAGTSYLDLEARVRAMAEQALTLLDASAQSFELTGRLGAGNVATLPLGTQQIIDSIVAGNQSARESARTLAELKTISEQQAGALAIMAQDLQGLRLANESLNRELSMIRNQRAS